ncbi:hypothetical protein DPMN_188796 [Dreissena polymorpha]|uniref:Uncharacterized protein n=1 Tax=Dreissena polymorpha TaxID=45954 RepID=A0A9D4IA94_DREPO|nr:hypothetical protein DPMN_188796 [Dreissena polymorpha]
MNRDSTGMNRGSIWDDRDEPGLRRESIKMFNTSGMNRESPATTGAAPRIQTPAEQRQRPGECR